MFRRALFFLVLSLGVVLSTHAQPSDVSGCDAFPVTVTCKLLDDFESAAPGEPPSGWRTSMNRELLRLTNPDAMSARQNVYVREEGDNQFARIHTEDRAYRVVLSHKHGLDWHLGKRPYLRWSWRAKTLPEGANEKYDDSNDTGGALYVTFDTDWLGRPKSIKYTYSSALPVGTTVDYGTLKVLVVASKAEQGLDTWSTHERNVVEDYERLFGDTPANKPRAVMMWSDSDTMDSVGRIDFDDLLLLSKPSRSKSAAASSP